jgi:hypothetical protein
VASGAMAFIKWLVNSRRYLIILEEKIMNLGCTGSVGRQWNFPSFICNDCTAVIRVAKPRL